MEKKRRTWMDLLLNRQIKPAHPEQSREHLQSNPLTYDRRQKDGDKPSAASNSAHDVAPESCEPASDEAGPETVVPASLIYQRNDNANTSERLRQSIQSTAGDARVEEDDAEEPSSDTIPRNTPRRSCKRVLAPANFLYFVEPDQFVRMELTVLLFEGKRPRALDCYLYDVTDQGMGFVCPEQLNPGDMVSVCAHLTEDLSPLVDTMVEIRNVRPLPEDAERPEKHGDRPLWIHGALLEEDSAMVLLKATLDCITLQYATAGLLSH